MENNVYKKIKSSLKQVIVQNKDLRQGEENGILKQNRKISLK